MSSTLFEYLKLLNTSKSKVKLKEAIFDLLDCIENNESIEYCNDKKQWIKFVNIQSEKLNFCGVYDDFSKRAGLPGRNEILPVELDLNIKLLGSVTQNFKEKIDKSELVSQILYEIETMYFRGLSNKEISTNINTIKIGA